MPPVFFLQRAKTSQKWFSRKILVAACCAALADWLLFDHAIGLSLVLFLAALGIVVPGVNAFRAKWPMRLVAAGALFAGLLALLVDVSPLSILFALAGLLAYTLILSDGQIGPLPDFVRRIVKMPITGPFQLIRDWKRTRLARRRRPVASKRGLGLVAWIAPLGFGAVFVTLFAAANPLIEGMLSAIDLRFLFSLLAPARMLFWTLVVCAIWPLLHLRARRVNAGATFAKGARKTVLDDYGELFGETAILRSLVLFNALFALQTMMDLTYLWGGVSLPDGMSHAAYAHRGAYPLVFTALLAAGFVLAAMRRGGPAETSRLIKPLVLGWIAQNVLLVMSSILRLNLYVAAYSLTCLRIAAFIWMGLVACGLLMIVVQIALRKSNGWLLTMNGAALTLALYACCYVNFPDLIGGYNLAHQREAALAGHVLDVFYLDGLGSFAIPALDQYLAGSDRNSPVVRYIAAHRDAMAAAHRARQQDWRAWSFEAWRLSQYLANREASADSAPLPAQEH